MHGFVANKIIHPLNPSDRTPAVMLGLKAIVYCDLYCDISNKPTPGVTVKQSVTQFWIYHTVDGFPFPQAYARVLNSGDRETDNLRMEPQNAMRAYPIRVGNIRQ